MERLTIQTQTGVALKLNNPATEQEARKQLMDAYKIAVSKLAAYEDTGLSPEEITELNDFTNSQCIKLLAKNNALQDELAAYREIGTPDEFRALKEKEFKHQVRGMHIEFIDLMQQNIEAITKMYVPKSEVGGSE